MFEGCGDNSCITKDMPAGGMGTNGGCRCDERALRKAVHYWKNKTPDARLKSLANFQRSLIQCFLNMELKKPGRSLDTVNLYLKAIKKIEESLRKDFTDLLEDQQS